MNGGQNVLDEKTDGKANSGETAKSETADGEDASEVDRFGPDDAGFGR